jgi:hypothetical protein
MRGGPTHRKAACKELATPSNCAALRHTPCATASSTGCRSYTPDTLQGQRGRAQWWVLSLSLGTGSARLLGLCTVYWVWVLGLRTGGSVNWVCTAVSECTSGRSSVPELGLQGLLGLSMQQLGVLQGGAQGKGGCRDALGAHDGAAEAGDLQPCRAACQ